MVRPALAVSLALILTLSACGGWRDSRANPSNWFGGSREVPVEASTGTGNPLVPQERSGLFDRPDEVDPTVPVAAVSDVIIERTRSGAIIRAEGVADYQFGFFAELRPLYVEELPVDGVLTYQLRVAYPEEVRLVGDERLRKISAARSVSDQQLEGVRVIRVTSRTNARETRRR